MLNLFVQGFIVQFGISLNTELENKWSQNTFPDDPNLGFPFERGYISYAGGGPNSRATQVYSFSWTIFFFLDNVQAI